jgi:hypothetical protein
MMTFSFDPAPIARAFWRDVGYEAEFARDLSIPIFETLPLGITGLPRLTVHGVSAWLEQHGGPCLSANRNRPLRGCLVAHKGHGMIFIEGLLPAEEKRITIAHELAHFLHHYLRPRAAAARRLGLKILEVLDGDRPPTLQEQVAGALRNVETGRYEDLINRHGPEQAPSARQLHRENEADMIALELLAPADLVRRTTPAGRVRVESLVGIFGLPYWAAEIWASYLDSATARVDPVVHRLERVLKTTR